MRNRVLFIVTIGLMSALLLAFTYNGYWWVVGIFVLLMALTIHDIVQKRHSLLANFPLVGRMRWIIEELRPFVQQYLLETETRAFSDQDPVSLTSRTLSSRASAHKLRPAAVARSTARFVGREIVTSVVAPALTAFSTIS